MNQLNQLDEITKLSVRIEERVNNISQQVDYLQAKLLNGITDKLADLEKRMILIEANNGNFVKWTDLGFKIMGTVVSAVVLYKLFGIGLS